MKRYAIVSMLALSFFLSSGYAVEAKSHKNSDAQKMSASTNETAPDAVPDKIKVAKKDKSDKKDKGDGKDSKDPKPAKDAKETKDVKDAKDSKDEKGKKKDEKAKAKDDDKKAEVKTESKTTEADADKKKGGLFHIGSGKKKEETDKTETAKKEGTDKTVKTVEDPNKPKYKFDPALISVLKDINKSLKDSEAVTKLEDPVQKLIAKLSGEALDKALAAPDLHANRIVEQKEREQAQGGMSAESWESGGLDVSPELKASVVALWAKKIDGLLTVEIVGKYDGKAEGASDKLGEFITVITARSAVDKGFDIQSQQDVNFWIGKVADLKIDYTSGKGIEKSHLNLYSPLTQRKREFLLAVKEYEDKLAKAEEDKKKQAELKANLEIQQKQVTEALARTMAEALAKQVANKGEIPVSITTASAGANAISEINAGGSVAEKKSEGSSDLAANSQHSEAPGNRSNGNQASANQTGGNQTNSDVKSSTTVQAHSSNTVGQAPPASVINEQVSSGTNQSGQNQATSNSAAVSSANPAPETAASGKPAPIFNVVSEPSRNSRSNWDSPAGPTAVRQPSAGSALLYPNRAVAGQYLTVAVIGPQSVGEQFVGLSFNGAQLSTGDNGKVVYQVPEDAPPGYSLRLALSDRPEEAGAAIEVLQPLAAPSSPQIPNLESVSPVCGSGGIVTIAGHNFDGIAERNRVIIDGAYDATVLVSSPVQLKARLPQGLPSGAHSLCVSNSGLRSNPGNFDLVTVDLAPAGPDTPKMDLKKLMVKVQGTHNRVRVKLVNQSRDVIKLLKGDDVVLVTPGGAQNQIVVPVQRLRAGNYKIDAEVLI